ncbi:outer membrane beta-barrel protein [Flagellatimonas centrodinii]|uniref:OmpW/AlkL family protein n=1 Tax=Flagellatimonas centrodinii TaxID=2806210 RepID=UPI001FF01500|nr:OmpW family outer membrane protein [Flagellatimonas centrodinii]ULQ47460.1 outer membrane beta-barrel protein [Flagellatimonas centrodinii]
MPFLLLPALLATLLLAAPAWAQRAGDVLIEAGWLHSVPNVDNGAPRNTLRPNPLFPLLGVASAFSSEGVRIDADTVNTFGLVGQYFLTDDWAAKLVLGYPPKAAIDGSGIVQATGPLGNLLRIDLSEPRFNPMGSARQWVPVLLLSYHFGPADAVWRPYLSAGFTYAFFTESELNDTLEAETNARFGVPLALAAGIPGPTRLVSKVESTLAPAVGVGVRWHLTETWSLSAGLDFIALETDAVVRLLASDGTELGRSRTRLRFHPVNVTLLVGYRF